MAAIVLAAALWLVRGRGHHEPAAAASDPAAGLDPRSAFARALDLGTRGRHTESLPYFRRALDGGPVPPWLLHRDLAAALQNSAIEVRSVGTLGAPVTRASVERVAMIREALHEFDEAESLAPGAGARARNAVLRGRLLEFWGFPWDALADFERAVALAPDLDVARQALEACRKSLGVVSN